MDGNGRWASKRFLPRVAGHKKGVDALRAVIEAALQRDLPYITVFAFSSENWSRPSAEVSALMYLFAQELAKEAPRLHEKGVRLRFIGDRSRFSEALQASMTQSEALTAGNSRMHFTVAMSYGGRWDMLQAATKAFAAGHALEDERAIAPYLSMAFAPDPDLLIRTGGEHRISNFLLWQAAYSELYFSDVLWPDFDGTELDAAMAVYQARERRFGKTSEQISSQAMSQQTAALLRADKVAL